jgi:hypothetical protein
LINFRSSRRRLKRRKFRKKWYLCEWNHLKFHHNKIKGKEAKMRKSNKRLVHNLLEKHRHSTLKGKARWAMEGRVLQIIWSQSHRSKKKWIFF